MCSYSFIGERLPLRCPYCAAKAAVTEVKDAQTLLDDSNHVEEDIRNIRLRREDL
jgi:hypothetical protein